MRTESGRGVPSSQVAEGSSRFQTMWTWCLGCTGPSAGSLQINSAKASARRWAWVRPSSGEPLRPPSSCHMRSVRRRHAARTCSPVALSNRAWISTEPSPWVLCQPARRARCFAWRSSVSVADVCLPTNSRALRANRSAGIASAVFTNASATSGVTCSAASATIAACSTLSRPSANDSASAGISARPRAVTMSFLA